MQIYKTLTQHTNGKVADETSSTGWKKRIGTERIPDPGGRRSKDQINVLWDEAPAPLTVRYGEPDPVTGEMAHGGTIHTHFEGTPALAPFTAVEVELVIKHLVKRYCDGLFVLNGGTFGNGGDAPSPADAMRSAMAAHARVLELVGVDLDDTNVAFPHRLNKPNHTEPLTPAAAE
jgi:hypothetical protein